MSSASTTSKVVLSHGVGAPSELKHRTWFSGGSTSSSIPEGSPCKHSRMPVSTRLLERQRRQRRQVARPQVARPHLAAGQQGGVNGQFVRDRGVEDVGRPCFEGIGRTGLLQWRLRMANGSLSPAVEEMSRPKAEKHRHWAEKRSEEKKQLEQRAEGADSAELPGAHVVQPNRHD